MSADRWEVDCSVKNCTHTAVGETERQAVINSHYHYLNEHNPTEEQERVLRERIEELENGGPLEAGLHPAFAGQGVGRGG